MRKLLTLTLLFILLACQSESQKQNPLKYAKLVTPSGEVIETTIAYTLPDQEQGLSGVKPHDFKDNQGLLFYYQREDEKYFWMPDTYFDLDLFYMDKDLKILDIVRKLPFYVGRANPDLIPRARGIWARHVLEMKASSEISQKLKIGDRFTWKGGLTLEELDLEIKKLLEN